MSSILLNRIYNFVSLGKNWILTINLLVAILSFLYTTLLYLNFDTVIGVGEVIFLGYTCYIDGLTLSLLFLNSLIYLLGLVYSYTSVSLAYRFHSILLGIIHMLLFGAFLTNNLLLFYLFFEALLIPMYILIGLWGSRGRRIHAAYQFFFFTFVSSIFLLIGIGLLYLRVGSLCYLDFDPSLIEAEDRVIIILLFFFGFMAKIPVYPLHIWLPEAHVEAPTVGSVILAAILLKLGFYGMYRVFYPLSSTPEYLELRSIFVTFAIVSLIYSGLVAIRQIDLKKIIAYSSIVHMNFGLLGLFGDSIVGYEGGIFIMVCHGLISAAMFFSIGILYDRYHVRNIMYYGGLIQYMPVFGILFFFIMISNMSFPGTCNFIGEFLVYLSVFQNMGWGVLLLSLISVFVTSLFCMAVAVRVLFYQVTGLIDGKLHDLTYWEFIILFVLSFYIFLFGIFPNLLLQFIVL